MVVCCTVGDIIVCYFRSGWIAGVVVGSIVGVIIIVVTTVICCRIHRAKTRQSMVLRPTPNKATVTVKTCTY